VGLSDCEDLAIWTAAGLRETGEDPEAYVRIVRTGRGKLHAMVQRSDGSFEDPSIDLMTPEDLKRYTDA
jgi:bifunctional N-acetylglucosamine-1-phosphate-uridyltransferase/glucosamine-1-phosphate-acetyltransferase GlmU-like protein